MKRGGGVRVVAVNRKASHRFELGDRFEAGLVLTGTEVKSLREGRGSISEAFVRIRKGEAYLVGANIPAYEAGGVFNHDPERPRKLLLHKRELRRLAGAVSRKGLTIVPLKLYFKRGWAKLEIALAKGMTLRDRREDIKRREARREMERLRKRGVK